MLRTRVRVMGLRVLAALTALTTVTALAGEAGAQTFGFTFHGPGVGGTLLLTYGAATDATYPDAFEVTGISGTFSDTNNGLAIMGAPVLGLVPVRHDAPEPTNLLAPHDFSRFAVASGNPHGSLSYDNLFWPGGSPQTASDYAPHGGFLDIYGLLFDIGGGRVVNVWSNGDFGAGPDYGAAVTTASTALDYVDGGVTVSATPEPGSLGLVAAGVVVLGGGLARRRRRAA